jgi:hypothetical protein
MNDAGECFKGCNMFQKHNNDWVYFCTRNNKISPLIDQNLRKRASLLTACLI